MTSRAGASVTDQVKEERDAGRHLKTQSTPTPDAGLDKQMSATWRKHADSSLILFAQKSCAAKSSISSMLSYCRLDDSD